MNCSHFSCDLHIFDLCVLTYCWWQSRFSSLGYFKWIDAHVHIREYYLLITRVRNPCLIQISQDIPCRTSNPLCRSKYPVLHHGIISRMLTDRMADSTLVSQAENMTIPFLSYSCHIFFCLVASVYRKHKRKIACKHVNCR